MSHSEVYKWFELYFPQYAGDKVETWFQNGKNSIRIRQKNHQEFIFTFNNEGNWRSPAGRRRRALSFGPW